jgi:uncharacterized membrane protein YozB (DUF420 family)
MSGLFGTRAIVLSDFGLLLEIVVLAILFFGFMGGRSRNFRRHGLTMTVAVVLHAVSIFLVMAPSFVAFVDISSTLGLAGIVLLGIHVPVGILAEVLGVFLVAEWRFQPVENAACKRRKRLMRPLFVLWVSGVVLGVLVYLYFYVL